MFVAERFLSGVVRDYGKHPVSRDGGGTWYQIACQILKLKHHIHSLFGKAEKCTIEERTMQYIQDRTKSFDDYFPCRLKNCKLKYVINWRNLLLTIITR